MDPERAHAVVLCHRLIEFAESIAELSPLQRDAIVSSLESGSLVRDVTSALWAARDRERASHEHPTPVVHVDGAGAPGQVLPNGPALHGEPCHARPTLPTLPPGVEEREVPTAKQRSLTARGFPRSLE